MTPPAPPPAAVRPAPAAGGAALVVAVVLVSLSMRSPITGVGPVLPSVVADDGLGTTAAGVLGALPLAAFAGASAVVPRVAGRLGVQHTLVGALALLVAGAALRWAPGVVPLFAGTLALGVAIACANVLLPVVVRTSFPTRVAVMTSTYVVLMQLAGGAASGVAVPLADALPGGWRTALAVTGVPALAALLVWLPLLGTHADRPAPGAPRARVPWGSPLAWWVTAFMGAQSAVFYVLLSWLPTVLRDRSGLDPAAGGLLLSVLQGAGVAAGLVLPLLTRGPAGASAARGRLVMVGAAAVEAVGVLALVLLPGAPLVGVVLAGFGGGAALVSALAAMTARAADAAGAVALSGMAQSTGYLLAALGPVAAGALHELTGSWDAVLAALLVVALGMVVAGVGASRDAVV